MTKFKFSATPEVGSKNSVADPRIVTDLKELEEWLNGKNIESTDNLKKEGIAEESLSKPLQEKLTTKLGMKLTKSAVSLEGVTENFYEMETSGTTLTLPAPTLNRMIGAVCNAATPVKMTASSGKMFGGYLSSAGVTTVELPTYQWAVFLATGTVWWLFAGEPKREQKYEVKTYTKAELEAGVEISATRDALVAAKEGGAGGTVTIGGVASPEISILSSQIRVPASQKLKSSLPGKVSGNEFWVLLL